MVAQVFLGECWPAAKLEVEKLAMPLVSTGDEPMAVLPSLKVTLPMGVPVPNDTVAVSITACP